MLGKHLECSLREHHWDTGILTACATHHLGFSRKSNKNHTQFRVIDHVGPFPILEARCLFLTSHWKTQKSNDWSCCVIHGKDVNAPNHRSNYSSWRKKPLSTQSARKRDTKHKELHNLPLEKDRQSRTTQSHWHFAFKSPWFRDSAAWNAMRIIGLHSQRVRGFRCSKSPALIPEKCEYQGAGAPWHLKEPKQLEII